MSTQHPFKSVKLGFMFFLLGLLDFLPYCVPILLVEVLHMELKNEGHIRVSRAVGIIGYFTSTHIVNTHSLKSLDPLCICFELLWMKKCRFLPHVFTLLKIFAATQNQILKSLLIIYSAKSSFISERFLHEVLVVAGTSGYVLTSLFNIRSSCRMSGLD